VGAIKQSSFPVGAARERARPHGVAPTDSSRERPGAATGDYKQRLWRLVGPQVWLVPWFVQFMHRWPWLPQRAVAVPGRQTPAESQQPLLHVCWLQEPASECVVPASRPPELPPLDELAAPELPPLELPEAEPPLEPPVSPPSNPPRRPPSAPPSAPPLLVPPPLDELPEGVPGDPVLPPEHVPPLHVPPVAEQSWHCPEAPQAVSDVPPTHAPVGSQQPLHVAGSHALPLSSLLLPPPLPPLPPVAPVLPVLAPASSLYPDEGPDGDEASPLPAPVGAPTLLKPVVPPLTSPAAHAGTASAESGASAATRSESPPR
jgi:hypothetical protein